MKADLNSILIEGKLSENVALDSAGVAIVSITHRRVRKATTEPGNIVRENWPFQVRVAGKVAERIDGIKAGRVIRVVGRLAIARGQTVVDAEHVEIAPGGFPYA